MTLTFHHQDFILHPAKAMVWPGQSALLVADVHLGKATHFRKNGIGVPPDIAVTTLNRLSALIESQQSKTLFILGDFFHSDMNDEWSLLSPWRVRHPGLTIHLILGNHDRIPPTWLEALNIHEHRECLRVDGLKLAHHPNEIMDDEAGICGHIHPAIRIKGAARQSLRLPCFWQNQNRLVLPAFGDMTGMAAITPEPSDSVYAVTDDTVVNVSELVR